jgi:single-strand DNA-binding protein
MLNKVMLLGHLGKDPELRHTQGGTAVANFSIATNETWKDKNGEKQERTEWHKIVAWGNLGENTAKYLNKGSKAYVEGKVQTRKWQDNDGNDRWSTEIVAHNVIFLDSKSGGGGSRPEDGPPLTDDDVPY